jgi:hypothetical protein
MAEFNGSNAVGLLARTETREKVMLVYDALPPRTKFALGEAAGSWSPSYYAEGIMQLIAYGYTFEAADELVAAKIRESDAEEIRGFAAKSGLSAHVDAEASQLRYHSRRGLRRRK